MNRNNRFMPIWAALALAFVGSVSGPMSSNIARADSFASIHWAGAGTTSEALKGKTVVMVSFVTWCPICNGWAPEMLAQIAKASEDKPVVVLAVATDVDAAAGKTYMLQHQFVGPNILYGADANVPKEFGVEAKNLWNYVWFDPTGKVIQKGAAGSYQPGANNAKNFVVASQINRAKDLGKLEFVSPTMSAQAKEVAWAVELGDLSVLTQVSSPRMQRSFSKEDREALTGMQSHFLDARLASAKELSTGDVPQKIEALDVATMLGSHFRTTAQGKEAIKIAAALNGDPAFRKEVTACKQYNLAMNKAGGDDVKLAKLLRAVSVHYANTYYGELAKKDSETAAGGAAAPATGAPAKVPAAKDATPKSDSPSKPTAN